MMFSDSEFEMIVWSCPSYTPTLYYQIAVSFPACFVTDCSGLYGDFLQTMKANAAEHQLFVLLADYERLCQDNVTLLKKLSKTTIPGHQK